MPSLVAKTLSAVSAAMLLVAVTTTSPAEARGHQRGAPWVSSYTVTNPVPIDFKTNAGIRAFWLYRDRNGRNS